MNGLICFVAGVAAGYFGSSYVAKFIESIKNLKP
jgi:hypothetical protein